MNFLAQSFVGFKVALRYRFNFLVNLVSVPLSVLIYVFLWTAIFEYTGQPVIQGYSLDEMIGYYVVSMLVGLFVWVDVDKWISEDIRKGNLVVDLLRPMAYLAQTLWFEIGVNLFGIAIAVVPVFLIGFIFFNLAVAPWYVFIFFFLSLALGFLIAFTISFLVGITAFWFKETSGLRRVRRALVLFLSGGMIPLTFFPGVLQTVFEFLPFQYIRYTAINIYLQKYSFLATLGQLGVQLVWVVLLMSLSVSLWNFSVRKFSGEGT